MKNSILTAINEVKQGKSEDLVDSLSESTHLRNDLGLDSFDLAELTVRIEEKTGIDIFENGVVETVGEIYEQIDK